MRFITAILLAATALLSSVYGEFTAIRNDFQISNDPATGDFGRFEIGADAYGNYIVARLESFTASSYRITFRRFNSASLPLGPETLLGDGMFGGGRPTETHFSLAMTDSGHFAFAWAYNEGNTHGIYCARFNRDGTPFDNTALPIDSAKSIVRTPSIDICNDGTVVVAWRFDTTSNLAFSRVAVVPSSIQPSIMRSTFPGGGIPRISAGGDQQFVVAFDSSGLMTRQFSYRSGLSAIGTPVRVASGYMFGYDVDMTANGRLVAVWCGGDLKITAQRFLSNNTATGAAMEVLPYGTVEKKPRVKVAANGVITFAWSEGLPAKTFFRSYSESGTALIAATAVSDSAVRSSEALDACLGVSATAQSIVAWKESGMEVGGIMVQRLTAAGIRIGSPVRVTGMGSSAAYPSAAVAKSSGCAAAVWELNDSGTVFAQLFPDPWTPITRNVTVNTSGQGHFPRVACADSGAFVVWEDKRGGATATSVYLQHLQVINGAIGANTLISTPGATCTKPAVAATSAVMVAWEQATAANPDAAEITAIVLNGQGVPLRTPYKINPGTGNCRAPVVAAGENSRFAVAWHAVSGSIYVMNTTVLFRMFNKNGDTLGSSVQASAVANKSHSAAVDIEKSGAVILAWLDTRDVSSGAHVYWRRFGPTGTSLSADILADTGSAIKYDAGIAAGPDGAVIVCWSEGASNARSVRSRVFDSAGKALTAVRQHNERVISMNVPSPSVAAGTSGAFLVWTNNNPLSYAERDIWGEWTDITIGIQTRLAPTDLNTRQHLFIANEHSGTFDLLGRRCVVKISRGVVLRTSHDGVVRKVLITEPVKGHQ